MRYDVCIIGSGAGAGPVAWHLSESGYKVLVIEKGPWFKTQDFTKDEMVAARRNVYIPSLADECHVIERKNAKGEWVAKSTYAMGKSFWTGNIVGGGTNFMSGYFYRMKPNDFRLHSVYGPVEGANLVDWPISYDDLESWYTKVESVVGISGRVVNHSTQEPRSTSNFPYPPLQENQVSSWLDSSAQQLGYSLVPTPRAVLSQPKNGRNACVYSNYCGSYGCSTDAKGSSRAAFLQAALNTGNCKVLPSSKVFHLETNGNYRVIKAMYYDPEGQVKSVEAGVFVVAAQAMETARLLLMSKNSEFPNGLANNTGQVGKNIVFSAGGIGAGQFFFDELSEHQANALATPGVFVNRSLHHWYEIDDPSAFASKVKGGIVDFLFEHANPIPKAFHRKFDEEGRLLYGSALKRDIKNYFTKQRKLKFEIFNDWLPTDDCFVSLSDNISDKWGDPVAKLRVNSHPQDRKVARYLATKAEEILKQTGAKNIQTAIHSAPPPNLVAGGCRFGNDPESSVLDPTCKAHELENLYVTDGSFMPTGGSVPQTWTIYANAFRVADAIRKRGI